MGCGLVATPIPLNSRSGCRTRWTPPINLDTALGLRGCRIQQQQWGSRDLPAERISGTAVSKGARDQYVAAPQSAACCCLLVLVGFAFEIPACEFARLVPRVPARAWDYRDFNEFVW